MCTHFKDCLNVYLFMCTYLDMTLRNYRFLSMAKIKSLLKSMKRAQKLILCFYPSSKCWPCSKGPTNRINIKIFFEVLIQKSLEVKSIVIPIREYIKNHLQ